jgi:hypothetical protein
VQTVVLTVARRNGLQGVACCLVSLSSVYPATACLLGSLLLVTCSCCAYFASQRSTYSSGLTVQEYSNKAVPKYMKDHAAPGSLHKVQYSAPCSTDTPAVLLDRELYTAACSALGAAATDARAVVLAVPLWRFLQWARREEVGEEGSTSRRAAAQAVVDALEAAPVFQQYSAAAPQYSFHAAA